EAVGNRFAAKRLVANDLQVFAEIFVDDLLGDIVDPRGESLRAGRDGGKRIVYLMDDASSQSADGGEVFSMDDRLVHLLLFGNVLADCDYVRHLGVIDAHGNLGDLPDLTFTLIPGFLFDANDFAGSKDGREFVFEDAAWLPREHAEDVASK